MNSRQFKKLLRNVETRVQADQQWKAQQREVLLHAMRAQTLFPAQGVKRKMALNLSGFLARPVGAMMMIVGVVFGGVIASVSAATSSLPGQILYPLKLTTEKIQVSLASDKKEKVDLRISFAKKRLQEIKEVVKHEPDPVKAQEKIQKPIANLKSNLQTVKIAVEQVKEENNDRAIDIVESLKEVANTAADVAQEPEVVKAVAAAEAADKKAADEKAVADAQAEEAKKVEGEAPTQETVEESKPVVDEVAKKTSAVAVEIKKLAVETVSSTKEVQVSVIRKLVEKNDTKAKEEIKKYIDLLKKEREVKKMAPVAAAQSTILKEEVKVEASKTDVSAVKTEPAAPTTSTTVEVKTDTKAEATKAAVEAQAAKSTEKAATEAAEDQKKFDELVAKVMELLDKDDLMGALKLLGIAPEEKPVEEKKAEETKAETEEKEENPVTSEAESRSTNTSTSASSNVNAPAEEVIGNR